MIGWAFHVALYAVLLAGGLALPAAALLQRAALGWAALTLYGAALLLLVLAAFVLCLLVARLLFPRYWWLAQVKAQDVFEFDGVYFLGLRLSRVPTRVQRLLFGVDEQMRIWDLVLGVLFLVLLAPHALGFLTAHRAWEEVLPPPARFHESLHPMLLSSLPVMKAWGTPWKPDAAVAERVQRELSRLEAPGASETPGAEQRFQLAQLHLLRAFVPRTRLSDPFDVSPGERLYFNRAHGAQAVEHLRFLLALPDLQRVDWSGGALALIGFFHLSDGNFAEAHAVLQQALAELGEGDESRISRYQVLLLAAQSALMNGDPERAIEYLQAILVDERLPNEAYALAMEHYAEALRLDREFSRVPELLGKALELYTLGEDRAGIARVHVRLAALALDEGRREEASEALSTASSLAQGLEDGFMLNMIERLTLAFSG
jgi:tetratricopeptide (TPR) repeat protein